MAAADDARDRTCSSSVYTSTYSQIRREFHIPQLEAVAGLSLFVVGLGIGPMILAPLSEFYGRRPIYLVSFTAFTLLLLPCALAPNIAVLIVFRFLTGMAGSAFLSVAGGTVGDMFSGVELGAPMMVYTASPFIGPEIGPLVGGFINQNISWRWTFWIMMMWSGLELALIYFLVPETYTPVLLRRRAVALRARTGEERYHAPIERLTRSIPRTIAWSCLRPFQLLVFEPMVLLLCLFTALLLGVLYLFFQAFPLVFGAVHGFGLQATGLTFLGLFVGMVVGIASDPLWARLRLRQVARNPHGGGKSEPEFRLPAGIVGGVLVPVGLFWFSWSTYKSVHWIVPILASAVFGTGTLLVFSAVFTFLVDAYPLYAASALAANSFVRSSFAAAFPLFSNALYSRLGYQWAGSLLAFFALPMAPVMAAFMVWGGAIRGRSRFAGGGGK
ncbi:major facilitator superfamily domain-containing protein [Sphaerosporella brunnea]|uniref:Major facilitator superfamily domain-containing protein n=1 Tax=Sphaerosporella brunnea TaxID=1250544 RepID=A0A5J5F333_9PEZI|nr:major facilitator superfamily domain-containing protein [Sphaerosporella brunnea]